MATKPDAAQRKAKRREYQRDWYLKKTYGISLADYRRMLAAQDGRCAICQSKPRTMTLAVDHDHKTGKVRGLLCKRCNHDLLGAAHEDTGILLRAIRYLDGRLYK